MSPDFTIPNPLGSKIESAEIADGAVTTAKLALNAVETANIADNAVTAAKIASGATITGLGSTTLSSSAATLDSPTLDLDTDKNYMVVITGLTTGVGSISLFFNDDTTATNYYTQLMLAQNTIVQANRDNDALLYRGGQDGTFSAIVYIQKDLQNRPIMIKFYRGSNGTTLVEEFSSTTWQITGTNVTKIKLSISANALAVGTKISVYKI